MDLQLKDQNALVVGGAHGIGWAIAEAFAAEGANVAILDLDDHHSSQRCEELTSRTGVNALALKVDVVDETSLWSAASELKDQFRTIDHLVYAAGAASGKYGYPFWNLEPNDWPRVLDINLTGAVRSLHVFAPILRDRGAGSVLMLSSIAGQIGSQTDPPYSAAKAALLNWTQCAAKDLAPYKVRVNAICPGMVKTAINRSVWMAWQAQDPENHTADYDAWAEAKIRSVTPLGQWQTPEDVAAVAVFLASPLARNITGQTINVDGGQVMR